MISENIPLIASCIFVPEMIGFLGARNTRKSVQGWYSYLKKPSFNPPNWIFAPVWIGIYSMLGVSSYLIYQKGQLDPSVSTRAIVGALTLYGIQISLNGLWSILFFTRKQLGAALVELLGLWCVSATTTCLFYQIDTTAAMLLIPNLGWTSFAVALNYKVWALNPGYKKMKSYKEE